ncbi:glycosyltransferase [Planctellipticum variicoloris]|nr:glycosyltransferase [Planctomycetaceae bacterium SH412]
MRGFARALFNGTAQLLGSAPQDSKTGKRRTVANVPVNLFRQLPPQLVNEIDLALRDRPDLIQLEFADVLSLAAWLPNDIPRLFVHHQLHWIYSERFLDSGGESSYGRYVKDFMELQELALLNRLDAVITFSEIDAELLRERLDSARVHVSPFPVPSDVGFRCDSGEAFAKVFTFLGSSGHFPNRQGAEWLLTEIWPRIAAECPDCRLKVIGAWPEDFVKRWSNFRVEFPGFAEDLSCALSGTIMLVPLKIGSGIRTKILAAMAQKVPVVSTSVGYEGLLVAPESDLLVRDSAEEFAMAAVKLARNPDLYLQLSTAGYEAVIRHYLPEQVSRRRNQIYESVVRGRFIQPDAATKIGSTTELSPVRPNSAMCKGS